MPVEVVGDRYRHVRELGRGATGNVIEAFDLSLSRRVALKILGSDVLRHPTARQRMKQEAAALARIRHDNVVGIYDVLDHHGHLVLVLELVEGESLARRIQRSALPESEALATIFGILRGLQAVHQANLVHRDVKPANILLTLDGSPKVADLGVAHDGEGPAMTRTGSRLGTPEYMSPELIRGQPVDARADIYAAGIVLYEMLTGVVPFESASEYDVLTAQVTAPPDLGRLHGRASPTVIGAIARALEKDPVNRWQTAQQFADALQPALHSAGRIGGGFTSQPGASTEPQVVDGPPRGSDMPFEASAAGGKATTRVGVSSSLIGIAAALGAVVVLVSAYYATRPSLPPIVAPPTPVTPLTPTPPPPPPPPPEPCEKLREGMMVRVVRQPTAKELADARPMVAHVVDDAGEKTSTKFALIEHYGMNETHKVKRVYAGLPFFRDALYPSQLGLCSIVEAQPE